MTKEEIMQQWYETLTPDEKKIARRSYRETRQYLRERKPQPVQFAYGTSTPGYYAILETETKV